MLTLKKIKYIEWTWQKCFVCSKAEKYQNVQSKDFSPITFENNLHSWKYQLELFCLFVFAIYHLSIRMVRILLL